MVEETVPLAVGVVGVVGTVGWGEAPVVAAVVLTAAVVVAAEAFSVALGCLVATTAMPTATAPAVTAVIQTGRRANDQPPRIFTLRLLAHGM